MSHIRIMKDPQERKQEIVEAALELFSQKGFDDTTIQDIARKLNISQGLCYRYFKSKNEIFLAAAEFYAQQVTQQLKVPFSEDMTAIDKFNIIVKRIFIYVIRHRECVCNDKFSEFCSDRLTSIAKQITEVVIPIVKQGNCEGVFKCPDVEMTTRVLIYGLVKIFHEDMMNINSDGTKEYVKNYLCFLRNMMKNTLQMKDDDAQKLGNDWWNL